MLPKFPPGKLLLIHRIVYFLKIQLAKLQSLSFLLWQYYCPLYNFGHLLKWKNWKCLQFSGISESSETYFKVNSKLAKTGNFELRSKTYKSVKYILKCLFFLGGGIIYFQKSCFQSEFSHCLTQNRNLSRIPFIKAYYKSLNSPYPSGLYTTVFP